MTQLRDTTIEVTDVSHFVELLTEWHTRRVRQLEHLLDIPEGTEASHTEGETIVLKGDALEGFKIGIHSALSHLGELPFIGQPEDEPKSE